MSRVRDVVQVGVDILFTSVSAATKRILVQTGDVDATETTPNADNSEWWQQVGFVSLPPDPVAGKAAASGCRIVQGGHDVVFASIDARGLELYGNLKPGESSVYAAGKDGTGQARSLWKADGSITHYSRVGNAPDGGGVLIQIDAQNDTIRLLNSKGFGLIISPDGVSLTAKASGLTLESGGDLSLIAKGQAQMDGSGILLGSAGVPGVNSALMGATGLIGVPNPKIILGL